jgi:hypothetical protein
MITLCFQALQSLFPPHASHFQSHFEPNLNRYDVKRLLERQCHSPGNVSVLWRTRLTSC